MKKILLSLLVVGCFNYAFAQFGKPDPSFGNNGIVNTALGAAALKLNSSAKQVLIAPGGSIYIILDGALVTKRLPNGSVNPAYGTNGYSVVVPLINVHAALQPDGKIILVGSRLNSSSFTEFFITRLNANGKIDPGFGINGLQSVPVNINAVTVQKDGKIVVAGTSVDADNHTYFGVVRYNPDGSTDSTLNGNGLATTDFEYKIPGERTGQDSTEIHNAIGSAVAIQPDGKIIVGGYVWTGIEHDFAIARYTQNGRPDSTLDSDGKQTTNFGTSNEDLGYSVALQKDGKIILAGESNNVLAVARYTTGGIPDSSFNSNGRQMAPITSEGQLGNSVALQSNGKIVVCDYTLNGSLHDFAVARFNTDGSPDNSFDKDGILITDINSSDDYALSVAVQTDDKMVVAGYEYTGNSSSFVLVRYTDNGSPDPSFGKNGIVDGDANQGHTEFNSIGVQTDGKVISAGFAWNGNDYDFAVARYNTDGSPDKTFSDNGKQITNFGPTDDEAASVVIQSNGKIIVAGSSYINYQSKSCMVRYNKNGRPDSTFGVNGLLVTPAGVVDVCQSVKLQKDGKIVMAGFTFTGSNFDSAHFAVVRFNIDGSFDPTFSEDGQLLTDFESSPAYASSLAIQNDGKIVVAGRAIVNGRNNFAVARFTTNGIPDPTFSGDGKQNNIFGPDEYIATSLDIQNDGKIILAGYTGNSSFIVAHYTAAGKIDSTYGINGAKISYPGTGTHIAFSNDGRIAVGGDNFSIALYKRNGIIDSTFSDDGILTTPVGIAGGSIQSMVFAGNKLYAAGFGQFPEYRGVVARFLFCGEDGPLPVTLLDFKAVLKNKTVLLRWETGTEQNLFGFIIERSANGNDFSPVGFMAASGNSRVKINYAFADKHPLAGVNFYRLKMLDKDRGFTYSRIISVKVNGVMNALCVFPNPAKNIIFIKAGGENEKAACQVIDISGRILKEVKVILKGNISSPVYIGDLPKGLYSIKLFSRTSIQTGRFIKE